MRGRECPSRDELAAYVVGRLADDVADEAIAAHVRQCASCQAALETLDAVDDTLMAGLRSSGAAVEEPFDGELECRQLLVRLEDLASVRHLPGTELLDLGELGEYRIVEKLGRGGMGTVYKALHTKLGRTVALKVLPPGRLGDHRAISRFEREMKAAGTLAHPNIVLAHDAREVQGTRFLVMEFVEGIDLSRLVRRLGPLPTSDACELIRQAALGLQAIHEHGLVHRDVKASNLILTPEGCVKVLDLGLARLATAEPPGDELTESGQPLGTADYIAPEQAIDSHSVDIRADIYSLGCTLYKLLAGRTPFSGSRYRHNFEKLMGHVHRPVAPIRGLRDDVPDGVATVLDRMLAKDPKRRFPNPAQVAEAVAPFCAGADLPGLLTRAQARHGESRRQDRSSSAAADASARLGTSGSQPKRIVDGRRGPRFVPRWRGRRNVVVGSSLLAAMALIVAGGLLWMWYGIRPVTRPLIGTALLLQEDFAGTTLPEGWRTARGSWTVQDGRLAVNMSQRYYPGMAFAPLTSWRDYSVECEMRLDRAAAGIIFRHDEDGQFYTFCVRQEESNPQKRFREFPLIHFYKCRPHRDKNAPSEELYTVRTVAEKEYRFPRREYHRLRVEVIGNTMRAFIDGRHVLSFEDGKDPIEHGSIGLFAGDACLKPGIAFFRNLRVERLGRRPVAVWEFNEGQGNAAEDTSGSGNDAVLLGGATWVAEGANRALRLDGKAAYARVQDDPSQSGMGQLTIRARFKLHAPPASHTALIRKWGPLVDARAWEDDCFQLSIASDRHLWFQTQNAEDLGPWRAESEPIPLKRWVEIVGVYDGDRNTLYVRVEGQSWTVHQAFPIPREVRRFPIRDTNEPIEIGCDPLRRGFLDATIDWIRISDVAEKPSSVSEVSH